MLIPVLTIIGKSKTGKTTLMEKLIPVLSEKGYRVGTVKHHAHAGFEIDQPGKDTWRHAQAGSRHVVIAAPGKIASYRTIEAELSLDEVLEEFHEVDIVLVEGYKRAGKPSIETVLAERGIELLSSVENRIAVVADTRLNSPVPQFDLNDIEGVAALIEAQFLVKNNDLL
jgi:molybdopterin-guanine dinucleotide biosynthesis protein MobB